MFQKLTINQFIARQNADELTTAFEKFKSHFHNPDIQTNIKNSKEEQYQEGFLKDLFVNIFGYIINPNPNFNLTTELKNQKGSKKCDGAILKDNHAIAVIELKGTDTTDLDRIETQAFGYKNNQPNCRYVITSNFNKLRFYIDNSVEYLEFNLFKLTFNEFALMYVLLQKDNLFNDIPLKLKSESLSQEEKITKQLYKDYSAFKTALFNDLIKNNLNEKSLCFDKLSTNDFSVRPEPVEGYRKNEQLDQLTLFNKTQKLLDRLLFIFFAEDSGLLPANTAHKMIKEWEQAKQLNIPISVYSHLKNYFGYLNTGHKNNDTEIFAYNGGLFKPDDILDNLIICDDILYTYIKKLADYDFSSEIDVNILGHIFENSLSEIDEIKAQINGENLDKSQSKRKKDGVFYTPKYITSYIVQNTVGKLCDNKKAELNIIDEEYTPNRQKKTQEKLYQALQEYRNWLLAITICDPACGSGAFLNEALNFLIAEHRYIDELESKLTGSSLVYQNISNHILEHNLFGVDINDESVEIAKLSLWLRTAQPHRKLSNLNQNIKCGNSLIDDKNIAGDKAFNWQNEFPKVFENGGFDVVIGNPPYVVRNLPDNVKNYLNQNYESSQYQVELYVNFIEKSVKILNKNGCLSFITPNSWLKNIMMSNLREFILKNIGIDFITLDLPNIFENASVDTTIFKFSFNANENIDIIKLKNTDFEISHQVSKNDFLNNKDFVFNISVTSNIKNILDKLDNENPLIEKFFDVTRGVNPYDKYRGQSEDVIKNRAYHADYKKDETFVPELKGLHLGRYFYQWDNKHFISYGDWLAAPRDRKYFEGERIIFREILGKTLITTYINEDFIIDRSLYIAKPFENSNINIKYALTLLNSSLYVFYFKYKKNEFDQLFPKIRVKEFKELPIKEVLLTEQQPFIQKAELMLSLNQQLQNSVEKFLRTLNREFELSDYSKNLLNWYTLDYKTFIKELEKKKIKLSLSQKSEWEDFFLAEQTKATQLLTDIQTTDKAIDKMVYGLYGLTQDEIDIVENV